MTVEIRKGELLMRWWVSTILYLAFCSSLAHSQQKIHGSNNEPFLNELYFYPPNSREYLSHLFDEDWIVENATIRFPSVREMSGIAIIIYWSQLCPTSKACEFKVIDRILDYWSNRGKKVILAVATIGAPIEKTTELRKEFVPATPEWVLKKAATYRSPSNNFLGAFSDWRDMVDNAEDQYDFPRYDDGIFMNEIAKLVKSLGNRYDGNPAISYVRIGTGKSAEDNPYGRTNAFGVGTGMPGYNNKIWIQYSRQVVDLYLNAFHKTRLELDIGWTAIVAAGAKTGTPISSEEQADAQSFLRMLRAKNIFIAYNGIAPQPSKATAGATAANPDGAICAGFSPRADATTPLSYAAAYAIIEQLRQAGLPFGLEGNAFSDPCEAPARILKILRYYRPTRLVLFGDAAAMISYLREGANEHNRFEVDALTNDFVPWTKESEYSAHQLKAKPKIVQFAGEVEQLVRSILVSP